MKSLMLLMLLTSVLSAQVTPDIEWVDSLAIEQMKPQTKTKVWLKMVEDGLSSPVYIPVVVCKGSTTSPVLGLAAAIHGNEVNGVKVIQELVDAIDVTTLRGTLIAIPGINAVSIVNQRRRYVDHEDLNRVFPGKKNGNRSQQYVWQITTKILPLFDYLVDMHTASFGRENTLYVRAFLGEERMAKMAMLQDADIILNSKGPSAGASIASSRTMRTEAMLMGIPTITVEYGNPQVFQPDMIARGKRGVQNLMSWLQMTNHQIVVGPEPVLCEKSYWIYTEKGGYLEVPVALNQKLKKGDLIGIVRSPFGDIIQEIFSPEDGVVIGRSSNPVSSNGGRIIHLGITNGN